MKPQVIVVEGRNDASRLRKLFPNHIILTTNGSEINIDTVDTLKMLDQTHDIILFLDPDHAGERIRRLLSKELENVYHAFLDQEVAYSKNKKKIGVEHASTNDILEALKDIKLMSHQSKSDITHAFLFDIGLTGHSYSKDRRETLSKVLRLGRVNGKTLYHRLRMFNLMQKDIKEVLK